MQTDRQIREQYEIEKRLAARLRNSTREERRQLYTFLYDEFYRLVPHQSQMARRDSMQAHLHVERQMKLIRRFLGGIETFLEIGPGDCSLAVRVAREVPQVYCVDISREITDGLTCPDNLELIITDGFSIPVPEGSVDFAYSGQLMEHLHPDDALLQLGNIHSALKKGGKYLCVTPNRLCGPHDISKHFDDTATGFHLKEYTLKELVSMFRQAGFTRIRLYAGGRGTYIWFPRMPALVCERLTSFMPGRLCRRLAGFLPVKAVLGANIVGTRQA